MSKEKNTEKLKNLFEGLDEDEARLFIGKNSDYYLKIWNSFKHGEKTWSINWPAFLFSIVWLGYRKMYSIALYMLGFFLLLDIVQIYVNTDITRSMGIAFSASLGGIGNLLYFKHMKKKIAKIDLKDYPFLGRDKEIVKAGNGSINGVGIVFLMFTGYIIISSIILSFIKG